MYSQHKEDEEDDNHGDSDSLYPGAGRACPVHTPVHTVRMMKRMIVMVTVIYCIQVHLGLI